MADLSDDFDLVNSFIGGSEAAFNKIVLKYQQKIYWHARRMTGNHLDADEVVQEVLLVLFQKLKDFQFKPQSIGSLPCCFSNSLVFEKCLQPKNLSTEKGDGWAALSTKCFLLSIKATLS